MSGSDILVFVLVAVFFGGGFYLMRVSKNATKQDDAKKQ